MAWLWLAYPSEKEGFFLLAHMISAVPRGGGGRGGQHPVPHHKIFCLGSRVCTQDKNAYSTKTELCPGRGEAKQHKQLSIRAV
jgi:hypothetical protein